MRKLCYYTIPIQQTACDKATTP